MTSLGFLVLLPSSESVRKGIFYVKKEHQGLIDKAGASRIVKNIGKRSAGPLACQLQSSNQVFVQNHCTVLKTGKLVHVLADQKTGDKKEDEDSGNCPTVKTEPQDDEALLPDPVKKDDSHNLKDYQNIKEYKDDTLLTFRIEKEDPERANISSIRKVRPVGRPAKPASRTMCEYCGKHISDWRLLVRHIRTHTEARPYKCLSCTKSFPSERGRKEHEVIHGERRFQCQLCTKAFHTQNRLTIHLRRHKGEKRFLCELCGKGFVTSWNLQQHLPTHTRAQPHECPVCHKTFSWVWNMRTHLAVHAQDKKTRSRKKGVSASDET